MKRKRLPALHPEPKHWEPIEEKLKAYIRKAVFMPLLEALDLGKDAIQNAKKSPLILAIGQGKIQYVDGHFEGEFSAPISRELRALGARWNARQEWWTLDIAKLPELDQMPISSAIGASRSRFQAMADRANKALSGINIDEIAGKLDLNKLFEQSLYSMDAQFQKNVEKVGLFQELTPDIKKHIAKQYTENSKLDIKKWTESEIASLRKRVEEHTLQNGLRRERLIPEIKRRYGVTERKAKFLARQETSLLMAAFQEKRYQDAGIKKYEWRCVNNPPTTPPHPHQVRPDHWDLDGSVQLWASPPVVDRRTGKRAHPKQDYNCRCQAIPVIE